LWSAQGQRPAQFFKRGWEGPILALSVKLPGGLLHSILKPGSAAREKSRQRLLSHGIDIDRMFNVLTGELAGLAWFDAEAFLKNLVEGTARFEPKGAALVEMSLQETAPWENA